MNAVDTNILIYAHDSREPRKQQAAESLVQNLDNAVLLWQVACEYISVGRKLQPLGFSAEKAIYTIKTLQDSWTLALPTWSTHQRAIELMSTGSLSWWDSLLVAACLEAGVTRLYSEDMTDGALFEGLIILNPFQNV